MNSHQLPKVQPVAIPRPQVGIERLPTRRSSNEPRELMNCKSCRKRKIKCNRLRPACEACQVFQCPCVYDATPKKRGPKGDVLEALLRRVDGLEAKLKEKNADEVSPIEQTEATEASTALSSITVPDHSERPPKRQALEIDTSPQDTEAPEPFPPLSAARESSPSPMQTDALLDTYFNRLHAKPYYILDESSIRQRMQLNRLPTFLTYAISAVAARYTPHPNGYQAAVNLSEEYATIARGQISTDDPSIDGLQASLLLVIAFTAAGKGKKAYMLMTIAVGMATALEMHREMDPQARITPVERELRRRLFWTCYLLDRFNACGSKRPSLIGDKVIMLRLPCWSPNPSSLPIDGEFFQAASNHQHFHGAGRKSQGSSGMLIDITRILGTTNQYLAAGGVKGDSHFPWHSLSRLSKIRQDLDVWVTGTDDVFSSLNTLFGQVDSTVLVLSKLIYHLIHCIIYRPFLPIDLAELAGNGQHQSWQIESTNMCFMHANAISELIDLGKQTNAIEWPAFVGYCICTAATVHIHGAHYSRQGNGTEMNVFSSSTDFLSREMQQLSELRYAWASVQHQRETLQGIYNAHAELVQTLTNGSLRYKPGFQLEDFFNRYSDIGGPGGHSYTFDAANLSLVDIQVDFTADAYNGDDLFAPRVSEAPVKPSLKRKTTGANYPELGSAGEMSGAAVSAPGLARPSQPRRYSVVHRASPGSSMSTPHAPNQHMSNTNDGSAGYDPSANQMTGYEQYASSTPFDPMFGNIPTNAFGSPAAWQTDSQGRLSTGNMTQLQQQGQGSGMQTSSPGNVSSSTGTHSDDKDPFLSLLEQLAENEQRMGAGGTGAGELDFLAGFGGSN